MRPGWSCLASRSRRWTRLARTPSRRRKPVLRSAQPLLRVMWTIKGRRAIGLPQQDLDGAGHCRGPALRLPVLVGDEHVLVGNLLEQGGRLTEVGGQHVGRVTGDPLRQVDRLVGAVVEADEDAALLVADVLDGVAVPLRD